MQNSVINKIKTDIGFFLIKKVWCNFLLSKTKTQLGTTI